VPCGLVRTASERAPVWMLHAVAAAARGAAVLATAGLGVVLVGLVVSAETVRDLFTVGAPDAGSATGLGLLSIGYLPNAGIWGSAWLAGPGVSLGGLSSSPFDTTGAGVPAVPLLGALPLGPAQSWWPLFLLIPVAAGVAIGRRVTAIQGLGDRIRAVLAAAILAGSSVAVIGWVSGGRLGTGFYDPVEVPAVELMLVATGWFLLAALPIAWWGARSVSLRSLRPGALVRSIRLPSHRAADEPLSLAESVAAARSQRYGAMADDVDPEEPDSAPEEPH
jgi:hypothetical protein